jgi:alkanesulfonate monooxygenase SsuD/methylene tetrahydromethanopterin reductase-like flavin-dependent oxidoreductase (luciferase family)
VQQPTPPIFVSGSSKDSGEFAARKRVGLGLAFTNLPLAAAAARFYREKCAECGWQPTPDQIIYQLPVHVADGDEKAFANVRPFLVGHALSRAMTEANRRVASSGFFGARDENLTRRFQNLAAETPQSVEQAIEHGTILCGGPDTVAAQIRRLRAEIGCGVLNLIFERNSPPAEKLRSIELFAKEVMPQVRDL